MVIKKGNKRLSNGTNGDRWTLAALKDYVDTKFEAVQQEASRAAKAAEKLAEDRNHFITTEEYNLRHESLISKLDEMRRTPWGTYYSFAMVLTVIIGGFWGLAYGPIQSRFDQLERRDIELREDMKTHQNLDRQNYVSQEVFKALEKRFDEKNQTQDKRADSFMTLEQFNAWKYERDMLIRQITDRIDRLFKIADELREPIGTPKKKD